MCSCATRLSGALPGGSSPWGRACQLAADLGVNTMTVSKAYQALKAEGFLETDRRHGATVCRAGDPNGVFREKLAEELELLIAEAKLKGVPREEFFSLCTAAFAGMEG